MLKNVFIFPHVLLFGWVWNSGLAFLILQIYSCITPTFSFWTSRMCTLIFLSLLFYVTSSLCSAFWRIWWASACNNFEFFLPHFNFQKLFYVLWMLGFFVCLFWSDCSHFIVAIYSLISLKYLQYFICHALFPPYMGSVLSKLCFLIFVSPLFFTWEPCTFLIVCPHEKVLESGHLRRITVSCELPWRMTCLNCLDGETFKTLSFRFIRSLRKYPMATQEGQSRAASFLKARCEKALGWGRGTLNSQCVYIHLILFWFPEPQLLLVSPSPTSFSYHLKRKNILFPSHTQILQVFSLGWGRENC